MNAAEPSTSTPQLADVRRRRRELLAASQEVERALAVPAGRATDWSDLVASALVRLRAILEDHVERTEAEEGLFTQITGEEPRLEKLVAKMREEHDHLMELVTRLLARVRGAVPDADDVKEIREDGLELVTLVSRHRQRGSDLLYEAYSLDLSGGE